MVALRWAAVLVGLLLATPARGEDGVLVGAGDVGRWRAYTEDASRRFGVPVAWIERVMHIESRGRTTLGGRPIVSSAGAMGLMQLMPGTWRDMRARLRLGTDPHDPRDNILAGTAYLRLMYDSFGYPGLFAAYNAGPARYSDHLRLGRALPAETRTYLDEASRAGAEAARGITGNGPARRIVSPPGSGIFFALSRAAQDDAGARMAEREVPD